MLDYIGSIEYAADHPFLYPGDAVKKYLFQLFMDLISLLEEPSSVRTPSLSAQVSWGSPRVANWSKSLLR